MDEYLIRGQNFDENQVFGNIRKKKTAPIQGSHDLETLGNICRMILEEASQILKNAAAHLDV